MSVQRIVRVRIGTFRTAYHPSPGCPALNGKPETYRGQETMTEARAQERGLTLCGQCPPVETQPVETEFADAPMYEMPLDYRQTARPFTVVVAGPGRHTGEPGSAFVVEDYSTEKALARVLSWYLLEHETVDALVVAGGRGR